MEEFYECPPKVRGSLLNNIFRMSNFDEVNCLEDYLEIPSENRTPRLMSYCNMYLDLAYEHALIKSNILQEELEDIKDKIVTICKNSYGGETIPMNIEEELRHIYSMAPWASKGVPFPSKMEEAINEVMGESFIRQKHFEWHKDEIVYSFLKESDLVVEGAAERFLEEIGEERKRHLLEGDKTYLVDDFI